MDGHSKQRGVSLIEVLVAVFVFSVGLVGMAGLMVMAARSSQSAYLRTQVAFLANNMAERMRANPIGVWSGSYNGNGYPINGSAMACDAVKPCGPVDVASRDKLLWSQLLGSQLPGASATIQCKGMSEVGFNPASRLGRRPPYGGSCAMSVTWVERGAGDREHASAAKQVFTWAFQP